MHDAGKVITGLVVFFLLVTSPIWYNLASGKAAYKPDPRIITDAKECVRDKAYMRASHMDLLDEWRERVVREGIRFETAPNGKRYLMSLSKTCMDCHSNKAEFCDACHDYTGVSPYCWNCHIEPKETK